MNLLASLLTPLLRFAARKNLPQRRGVVELPGLGQDVRVRWDPYAIPYLEARSEADLFFAQGYVHAQDRLWQMDLNRHFFSGRLAEIFGDRPLPRGDFTRHLRSGTMVGVDHFIRLLGIRHTAAISQPLLSERSAQAVEAYCAGVNVYMDRHQRRLPVEFRMLRCQPAPWEPVDCLTLAKGFSLMLSSALVTRLTFLALNGRLENDPEKLRSLMPRYPSWGATVSRALSDHGGALLRFVNGTFAENPLTPRAQGSNGWAVDAGRSAENHALLCNDMHLRMTMPGVWYLNHLRTVTDSAETPAFEAAGVSLPGSPLVYVGHNRDMAWGFIAALCDDGDLYRERLHPEQPNLYRTPDGWAEFESRPETITVRGGRQLETVIRHTRHGPVLSDILPPASDDTDASNRDTGTPPSSNSDVPDREVLSFRWIAHMPGNEVGLLDGVNRARDWNDFLAGMAQHVTPSLNCVYADNRGNIGYALAGRVPLRRRQEPSWLPLEGWNAAHDWAGTIPFDELPRLYNPPEGIVASANNRIADPGYPYYLSDLFEPPYRIERIRHLLTRSTRLNMEDMARIQLDTRSVQAERLLSALRPELSEIAREEPALRHCVELLEEWDYDCTVQSAGAAVFHVLYHRLMWNLWGETLGDELFASYTEILNQPVAPLDDILTDPASVWFRGTTRKEVLTTSLREAHAELTKRQGSTPTDWSWGRLHTLTLAHALGNNNWLAPFFSLGPFPVDGDGVTVSNSYYRHSRPYDQAVGASMRMLVTLSDPIRSSVIIVPGQAGNPASPQYRDQFELWRSGRAISLAESEEEMRDWPVLVLGGSRGG